MHSLTCGQIFEKPSLVTQGLERVVLEANSFDFRCRYPQKCMIKLMKEVLTYEEARNIYPVALNMSIDMYKTFMPLKNTNFGMAYSLVELAARITGEYLDKLATLDPSRHSVPRMRICQGMLDLLELYTKHHKQTKLGARFGLDKFIQIKIDINNEIEEVGSNALPRCPYPLPSNEDLHATPLPADLKKVTNRFVFDVDEARREQAIVKQHFEDEYVMVDVEVEVEDDPRDQVPDRPRDRGYNLDDRGHGSHRGGQDRGGRHGGGDGWSRGGRRGNDRRRRGRGGGGGGGGW